MTEFVSFNETPHNTWLRWHKKRKFVSCEEVFDPEGECGVFVHQVQRNTKSQRRQRMLVGGRR